MSSNGLDQNDKERILKRLLVSKHRVRNEDVNVLDFDELKEGINVKFTLDGDVQEELITWWYIAMNA